MLKQLTIASVLLVASSATYAQEEEDKPQACPALQASTIFVKDKTGSRKTGSAKSISETHDNAEALGWNFEDLEIYIEDGDLQGFFITYTRPHPCNKKK